MGVYHISNNGNDFGIWADTSAASAILAMTQDVGYETHEAAAEALGVSVETYLGRILAEEVDFDVIETYDDGRAFGCVFVGSLKGEWNAYLDDDGDYVVEYNSAADGATGNDPLVDRHGEFIVDLIRDDIIEAIS